MPKHTFMSLLTPDSVHKTLGRFFPAKNDDFPCDYREELSELRAFGVTSTKQLVDLLNRRAEEVMEIDRGPMDESYTRAVAEDRGAEFVDSRLREGRWFSYPALLRIALELEFGQAYEKFALRRDGILDPGQASTDKSRP